MTQALIKLALVVAAGENNVIGKNGTMPWRLSSDLKYFRKLTMGHPIIMGRKTFASIGKPLDGRDNIIITRDKAFEMEGVLVAHSIKDAIALGVRCAKERGASCAMVIGGGEIYRLSLPLADLVYLTRVHGAPDGDTFFPCLDEKKWRCVEREFCKAGEKDSHDVSFILYERVTSST